jgi:hypothetical protein
LALPALLSARYGKPMAIFAPSPAALKNDSGTNYSYERPLVARGAAGDLDPLA